MKKTLTLLMIVLVIAIALTGCGGGNSTANKPEEKTTGDSGVIEMKLANANPPGDIKDQVSLKFAELVKEKTNGKVEVKVFSGGTLGDWRDAIEGLGLGVDEIVIESIGTLDAWVPEANIDAVPYIFRDYDHFLKVWNGPVGQEMMDQIGRRGNFKLLGPMYRGARVVTSKKPFENLDQLKGLKIRVPNIQVYIKTWQNLGAAPTPLALTETFTALQQNTVEAQENPIIESYGFGFYDVCPYLVLTNHVYSADVFIFDNEYFNSLPEDIQTALTEAANEAAQWRNEQAKESENEFLKKFEEKGVKVIEPDLEPFRAKFDGFAEQEFPDLVDWIQKIKDVK